MSSWWQDIWNMHPSEAKKKVSCACARPPQAKDETPCCRAKACKASETGVSSRTLVGVLKLY